MTSQSLSNFTTCSSIQKFYNDCNMILTFKMSVIEHVRIHMYVDPIDYSIQNFPQLREWGGGGGGDFILHPRKQGYDHLIDLKSSTGILASVSFWSFLIIESVARVSQHVLFRHELLVKQVSR